jgi:TRAP transporter TAXI family solute receptor
VAATVFCGLVASFLVSAASAQTVTIITPPAGSLSNSAAAAIAKAVNEQAHIRMVVQPQASTGFEELQVGEADFNVSNAFDATFFATGTGDYKDKGVHKNLKLVASIVPLRVAMHVRADSNIKTIKDLKGKRVSSGFNTQRTIGRIIEAMLANAGLSYNDVQQVPAPNVVRAADDFKSGKVDVLYFAIGSAAVKEASATVGGLRVLPIDDSAEAVKRMQAVLPGSYVINVKPSPNLDGIDKPTNLIAFDLVLNASAKVKDDIVYRVAKAVHASKSQMAATFRPLILFDPAKMAKIVDGLDLHPGAAKFYREAGLLPK